MLDGGNRFSPINDTHTNALAITGVMGQVTGNTEDATLDAGEPDTGRSTDGSLWYRWIPPISGNYSFHTSSDPKMQAQVRIFTGTEYTNLNEVFWYRRYIPSFTVQNLSGPVNVETPSVFSASTQEEYLIQLSDYLGRPAEFNLSWGESYMTNDYFQKPIRCGVNETGSVLASNVGASSEWGEPATLTGGRSVWFLWRAPFSGTVIFDTSGSSIDTMMTVVEPTPQNLSVADLANVLNIASNDDPEPVNLAARVSFAADAGTQYWIAVDGKDGATGSIVLGWNLVPDGRLPDLTVDAMLPRTSISTFPPDHCSVDHGCVIPGTRRLLSFDTLVRNQGNADLFLLGFDDLVYEYHPCHDHEHLVGFAEYRLMTNGGGEVLQGSKASFCLEDTGRWDPDAQSVKQYRCTGIQSGWADVYRSNLDCQWIDITGVPPGLYVLEQEVDFGGNFPELNESNNVSRLVFSLPPEEADHLNDFFGSEVPLNHRGLTTGFNTSATGEPGELLLGGGQSVWFQWTAPSNGMVTVDTKGSSIDTVLGVFTGVSVSDLTLVVQNNDWSSIDTYSRVTWAANDGMTYHIMIDSADNQSGRFSINHWFGQVDIDNFGQAGFSAGNVISTVHASKQAGEPDHAGNAGGHSVWFSLLASKGRPVTIETFGSDFDTLLAVYQGTGLSALTELTSNDDWNGLEQSLVTFLPELGRQYWIAVDGKDGDSGRVKLSVQYASSFFIDAQRNGDSFQFTLLGDDERRFTIETSTNMNSWISWRTFEIDGDEIDVVYPVIGEDQLFFRARRLPDD